MKRNILLIVLLIAGGIILGRTLFQPAPVELAVLPDEAVPVAEISAPDLAREAVLEQVIEGLMMNGNQLLDENGRLLEVVARLSVETEPVRATEPAIDIIREACIEETLPSLTYKASLDAWRFCGLDQELELAEGWTGTIRCYVRSADRDWTILVYEPFTLSNTVASSTEPPRASQRPHRYFAGLHYSILRSSTALSINEYGSVVRPTNIRVYAGVHTFRSKKWGPDFGLFADSDSAGITVGLSW